MSVRTKTVILQQTESIRIDLQSFVQGQTDLADTLWAIEARLAIIEEQAMIEAQK